MVSMLPSEPFVNTYLGYLLGQANHALYKDFDTQVRLAGLTGLEWRVLATLHDHPTLSVSALSAQVLSKQPTVTKLVQRMALSGQVALLADPQDQRRTLVSITPAGKKQVRPLMVAAQSHEAQLLRSLGTKDVAVLKHMLTKLATRS
jgi:DNA-binding MarR family transcriptional regulator